MSSLRSLRNPHVRSEYLWSKVKILMCTIVDIDFGKRLGLFVVLLRIIMCFTFPKGGDHGQPGLHVPFG
ncbi:hypothetical protein WA026_014559 [Henosepilachna vigintioctopunctata]|uniref:Uncharacterized protein n=1 Tax=Henosepilachna vigintioctopunctata TaxID=420089 RepID=A0AAW1VGL5_9CUCU